MAALSLPLAVPALLGSWADELPPDHTWLRIQVFARVPQCGRLQELLLKLLAGVRAVWGCWPRSSVSTSNVLVCFPSWAARKQVNLVRINPGPCSLPGYISQCLVCSSMAG